VLFAHDTVASLQAAVALVNSASPPDTLTTTAQLDAFYAEYRYTGRPPTDLPAVRALREQLRELLTADRDTAVVLVNRMLTEHNAVPQLVRHDGEDYHLHSVGPDAPFVVQVAVETAMAMVDLIRSDELSRLAICADDTCDGIVLDLSRNRSRRFCSTTCGNRVAVAAYRSRERKQRL
jgi:predicted RNA-binding Zn ribbon-like protein